LVCLILGRKKPIASGYRPQAFIRTADVACELVLEDGKIGMPGDNLDVKVKLSYPLPVD